MWIGAFTPFSGICCNCSDKTGKVFEKIALGVNCDNTAALSLYQKLGFSAYDTAEDDYGTFYRMVNDRSEERKLLFVCYPKCTTCQKAQKWLDDRGVRYDLRDIREENPTEAELRDWHMRSGLPLKRFFNTSGLQYKALNLKERLPEMSEDEQFKLLASDGMLVKRPLLIGDGFVIVGFKESEYASL